MESISPNIFVSDIDKTVAFYQTLGFKSINGSVEIIKVLEKTFYGAIEFSVLDVNNYVLTFAEHAK